MTEKRAELLLAAVISARATSFVFNKMVLGTLGTFDLLACRFLLAFILLAVLFWKRLRHISGKALLHGAVLGTLFFLTLTAELTALKTTDSSTVSLLENTAIILVPLLEAVLLRWLPTLVALASAGVAVLGVALLTVQTGGFTGGVGYGLLAALLYAAAIIATDRFSHHDDPLTVGIVQVGVLGLLALIAACCFETPRLPQTGMEWGMVLALAIVCTGFGFTLQPVAQSHTSAERAGLFCALSPACATLFGAVLLHEKITLLGAAGILLILSSLLLPHLMKGKKSHEIQGDPV